MDDKRERNSEFGPSNASPEPVLAPQTAGGQPIPYLVIQASWSSGEGWLQFDQGALWPSGMGWVTQKRSEASQWRPDYWSKYANKGYLGMWTSAWSSWSWLSWNDGPEFPQPTGGIAQVRVWASAVEWELKDGFLIPVKWPDRKLSVRNEKNVDFWRITVRGDNEPLKITIEDV